MNTKLKNAREETGLTQIQVASKAKISVRQYQRYEKACGRVPNVHTARLIAEALGSTIEELFLIDDNHTIRQAENQTRP